MDDKDKKSVMDVGDKLEEYFRVKDQIKVFRRDLLDHKAQMPQVEKLAKAQNEFKKLREEIKSDSKVADLTEKISTLRERLDLVKELLRIEMLETAQQELRKNGRKLKLVNILREEKDDSKQQDSGRKLFR